MRGELRKITGSQRLCLLLVLAVLCSGVLFALHATGDSGGYTVSGLRHAMARAVNTTPCAASCTPPMRLLRGCGRRRNIRPFGQAWRQNPA